MRIRLKREVCYLSSVRRLGKWYHCTFTPTANFCGDYLHLLNSCGPWQSTGPVASCSWINPERVFSIIGWAKSQKSTRTPPDCYRRVAPERPDASFAAR